MVIRASSRRTVQALIADLTSDSRVTRDAAIARLTVIGSRAVELLAALVADVSATAAARVAALQALEGVALPAGLHAALPAMLDPDADVAAAAARVARPFVRSAAGLEAIDRLTSIVLEPARPERLRMAAAEALAELDARSVRSIAEALEREPNAALAAVLRGGGATARRDPQSSGRQGEPDRVVQDAAGGALPDDPAALRTALGRVSGGIALSSLQRVIDLVREREGREDEPARAAWTLVRGAAHAALARRGSRLALYDLRETFERAAEPLPLDFLAALSTLGDRSCLEPIAAAFGRTEQRGVSAAWWRRQLREIFTLIVSRERLTPRHAVLKKIEARWPGARRQLLPARDQ